MIHCVVTSFKRPLQTDLILNCVKQYSEGPCSCIINMSDEAFREANEILMEEHPEVNFIVETQYREDVLGLLKSMKEDVCLFLDDDTVMLSDLKQTYPLIDMMRTDESIVAVSARMGTNIIESYGAHDGWVLQKPLFMNMNGYLKWDWTKSNPMGDWGYPHPICYNIYRVNYLIALYSRASFSCPREAEVFLDGNRPYDRPYMISNLSSITFTTPLNKASWSACKCSSDTTFTLENLKLLFLEGKRIDMATFDNFIPSSCHQEIPSGLKLKENLWIQ